MAPGRLAVLVALAGATAGACGRRSSSQSVDKHDAAIVRDAASAPSEVAARPLGMPDVAAYAWRKRGGQPAFRIARKAEDTGDWATVVTTCRQALTADPGHLEAAWLLAAALGRLGKPAEVLEPLQLAVAGDFGKWGAASLELPALQPFLATPIGQAWRRRIEADRAAYLASLARAMIVIADGDLYAFDPETSRWHRLTRTSGQVIGTLAVPSARRIAYVTRTRSKAKRGIALGFVDLARGRTWRPIELGPPTTLQIAYSAKAPAGFWIGAGTPTPVTWRVLDDDNRLRPLPAKTSRPGGPWLEVAGHAATVHAIPVPTVSADWDDRGLASAIRIGSSHRVVAAPNPGLIDGNTVTWSPDRSHLAFIAQLDESCLPGAISAAAFVADGATGTVQELERAANGMSIEWLTDRKLAIAGDRGVTIVDLDGAAPVALEGATELIAPRQRPHCTQPGTDAPPEPEPVEDPEPADSPSGAAPVGVGPTDAGVDANR